MRLSEVHQIELTSKCNLSCVYCVHRIMKRKKENMTLETFKKSLELCKLLWRMGTQKELWLYGLGESLVHPDFMSFCELARKELPLLDIKVSTNGELLKQEHIDCMADCGIKLHISMHRPDKLGAAPRMAQAAGILEFIGCNPVLEANDWAGQVEWQKSMCTNTCGWLELGWCVVYANGDITTCCVDAEGDAVVGNVEQPITELVNIEMKPFHLCGPCNLTVPEGM